MRSLTLLMLALCLCAPASALASGDDVIEDCADDNQLSRTYSQAEYKKALQDIPADLDEYTACRDIIRQARLRGAGGRSTTGGGDGRTERKISKRKREQIKRDLQSKQLAAAAPLDIGGTLVDPDSLESSSTIPAPLVVVLVLVALAAIAGGGLAIRKLVIGRRDN